VTAQTLARARDENAFRELYLSPRTVERHLKKVFTKLGISSRRGLQDACRERTVKPRRLRRPGMRPGDSRARRPRPERRLHA
jgi:hypothetical protein